ncbi:MAG TPA: PTS sugar transporter subunit IIA [Spirochaetota bacterium]|nr:PTS sugar transporter subunit IIA [Spirochaetota bacterium]HOR45864.1 PTS sugar transporter subunit IIA [Spirochaetota bacterium]HOU84058.1 PTS sugar transporter subunit IIA [Spirochaetota bacterium]HPK57561.1 PTS sugar transporter subunit IIA [Spirochaetota bacterium]HQE58350.1 PTS sugar transporter subunit IIA [Spirochaetota bacterium]
MKPIHEYTSANYIKKIDSEDRFVAIEDLAKVFEGTEICSNIDKLVSALKEREEIMSTGIGCNIAIPHAKIPEVKDIAYAIGVSKKGIDFDSMDGNPVHLVILVVAGEKQHKDYLSLLSNIMAFLKDPAIKDSVINAENPQQVFEILMSAQAR